MSVWPPEDRPKPTTRDAQSEVVVWSSVIEGYVTNARNLAARLEAAGDIPGSVTAHQAAGDWQFRLDSLHRAAAIVGAAEGNEDELRKLAKKRRERLAKAEQQGRAA